jgi:hypothetical protein
MEIKTENLGLYYTVRVTAPCYGKNGTERTSFDTTTKNLME